LSSPHRCSSEYDGGGAPAGAGGGASECAGEGLPGCAEGGAPEDLMTFS